MKWLPAQEELFSKLPGMRKVALVCRRQFGKTTILSGAAILCMIDVPGSTVTYCSASLRVGGELVEREAQLLHKAFTDLQADAEKQDLALRVVDRNSTAKSDLELKKKAIFKLDDFKELFEKSRLVLKLWHSSTQSSRTLIIAPNVDTARGFTGWAFLDEIAFIPDFKEMVEAMGPIASRDPSFRQLWATTPPADDAHYSYDLLAPVPGTEFKVNPRGNWYRSEAGIMCLRVDAWDAAAGGLPMLDEETGRAISPDESRKQAYDKDAWDRNFGIKFTMGGTSAVSPTAIRHAQEQGTGACQYIPISIDDGYSLDQACTSIKELVTSGPVGCGFDVATTEKNTSNPSSFVVVEDVGGMIYARLVATWKTSDGRIADEIVERLLSAIESRPAGTKARRLGIDATSERYYATEFYRKFIPRVIVELLVMSESADKYSKKASDGEMTLKQYLCGETVRRLEEGTIALPNHPYIREDIRLVKRRKGSYDNDVSASGQHGDVFDALKNAVFAVRPGGELVNQSVKVNHARREFATL